MRRTSVLILIAFVLIIGGMALSLVALSESNWDFSALSTVQLETAAHSITEAFSGISIQTTTASITLLPSADGSTRVVCYEEMDSKHTVSVQNSTLTIENESHNGWSRYLGIRFDTPKITVYLPENIYSDLCVSAETASIHVPADFSFRSISITTTTGDINVFANAEDAIKLNTNTGKIQLEQVHAASISLTATTGSIKGSGITCEGLLRANLSTGSLSLNNVTCSDFHSAGSTGSCVFENLIAFNTIIVRKTTGDVTFHGCDADEITIATSTGNVSGTFLTPKVYITSTKTGTVSVPASTKGGPCNITTSTGDIKFK